MLGAVVTLRDLPDDASAPRVIWGMDASSNPKWALAFLRGRASGSCRGNVPVAASRTAVTLAERHGVRADDISAALEDAGKDAVRAVPVTSSCAPGFLK